jgi:pimeloyl-ACP methyl ester carboxylesterase
MWREKRVPQSSTPFGGRFVKTSDGIFFSQILGYPEQPTVVLIHGNGAWSETWKPTMRYLAREGYRAIALDLPPFGLSFAPSKNFSRVAQAQRIKDALDNLRVKNLILVTHAEGSPAALTAAQMLGARLKGLVIVSGNFGWPEVEGRPPQPLPKNFVKALQYKTARRLMASFFTHRLVVPRLLKEWVYQPSVINSTLVKVYMTPFLYRGTNSKIAEWMKQYYLSTDNTLKTDMGFFKYFKVPTLLVWGDRDTVAPPWHARKLKELMPQAELVLMPQVGHIPQLENEKAFNEALVHFVMGIEAPVKLAN